MPAADRPPTSLVDPVEVAALLARPLDQFVAARTARAKELRAEGRREEAAALAKVRKPVQLVWVVGELARRDRAAAVAAADLAEEVEEAMANGGGVRALLTRFREVVGEVAGLVDDVEGGADRLEVGLALREVLADPAAREAWVEGRLLTLPGDEPSPAPPDELAARRAARAGTRPPRTEPVHPSGQQPADPEDDEAPEEVAVETPDERAAKEEDLRRAEAAYAIADRASRVAREARQEAEAAERATRVRQAEVKEAMAALKAEAAELRETLAAVRERIKAAAAVCDTRARERADALVAVGAAKSALEPPGESAKPGGQSRPRPRRGR